MNRRSTVTNDLKAMMSNSQHERPRDNSKHIMRQAAPAGHKRFESVNVRHSHRLGGISQSRYGQKGGASLLEDSSYASSLARSKAIIYNNLGDISVSNHNKSTAVGSVSNRIGVHDHTLDNGELSHDESK